MKNSGKYIMAVLLCGLMWSCGSNSGDSGDSAANTPTHLEESNVHEITDKTTDGDTFTETEPRDNARFHVNNIGPLYEVFNDSNKYHYAAAERIGIAPIHDLRGAYRTKRPLVKIATCDAYYLDSLTHSMPYLVPEAAELLKKIGNNFKDSLKSRGEDGYLVKVTSVLRTRNTVKGLRRINVNATDSSTHLLGTTFDISWSNFHCKNPHRTLHEGDLKNLLAEVLNDLRNEGRCLVKYEKKTACFHITAVK